MVLADLVRVESLFVIGFVLALTTSSALRIFAGR
jgi:hypothetical protein